MPNNVREITADPSKHGTCLRGVLLHRPDAHPCWHTYLVTIVHLRPVEGVPDAVLTRPDGTHEIQVWALDPNDPQPDPADRKSIRLLTPVNLVHQLRARSDEHALGVFKAFVQALSFGGINPDTDHRSHQVAWLQRWERGN